MDTYQRFPEGGLDKKSIINIIEYIVEKYGWCNDENPYEGCHNFSPTIEELLSLADEYGEDRIRFVGFTISPPRDDYGVDIDGFDGKNLTIEEVLRLVMDYHGASEMEVIGPNENGLYEVSFWWD